MKKIKQKKKYFRELKKSHDSVVQENQQLKEYIKNILKRYQGHLQQKEQEEFSKQKNYFQAQPLKNRKKYTTKN